MCDQLLLWKHWVLPWQWPRKRKEVPFLPLRLIIWHVPKGPAGKHLWWPSKRVTLTEGNQSMLVLHMQGVGISKIAKCQLFGAFNLFTFDFSTMLQLPWKLMEILHLSHSVEFLQLVHEQVVFMHPWFWSKWFQLCFNVNLFDKTYITRIAVVATPRESPVVFRWSRSCLDSGFWFNKELRYPIN